MMRVKFIIFYDALTCRLGHKLHHFRSIIHMLQSVHQCQYLRDQSSSAGAVLECCRGNKTHSVPFSLKVRWRMTVDRNNANEHVFFAFLWFVILLMSCSYIDLQKEIAVCHVFHVRAIVDKVSSREPRPLRNR